MAEGARLESVYTATYRGFESPLTAIFKEELVRKYGLFFRILHTPGDEKPRPGFDNWRQPVGQTVNAVSGLPAGRAKRVNPPSPPYLKKSSYESTGFFFVYCTHREHPKQSPVRPGSAPITHLTVGMQRTLAKCRTYAVLFTEPDDPNHFIFFETFQRVT